MSTHKFFLYIETAIFMANLGNNNPYVKNVICWFRYVDDMFKGTIHENNNV